MTLEDAVEALAKRATDLQSRPPTYHEKRAAGDILTSLGQQLKENPMLQHALLGAGLGAGVGGISTAIGNHGKEDKDKRSIMQSLLTGGLAGAAIGGGTGLAKKMLTNPEPQGLQHGEALQPGQFRGPDGKLMQFDPDTLRKNPEIAQKARELAQPLALHERAPLEAGRFLKDMYTDNWHTAVPMTGVAAIDTLAHNQRFNLGEKNWTNAPASVMGGVGGLANYLSRGRTDLGMGTAANWWRQNVGAKMPFSYGMVQPRNSRMIEHLDRGIHTALEGKPGARWTAEQQSLMRDLLQDRKRMGQIAKDDVGRGGGQHGHVDVNEEIPQGPIVKQLHESNYDEKGNLVGSRTRDHPVPQAPIKTTTQKPTSLSGEDMSYLMNSGARGKAEEFGKNPAMGDKVHTQPRVFRGFTGDHELPTGAWRGARAAGRLGLYAGIPLAQYSLHQLAKEQARENSLRDLVRQHAREVGGQ